MSDGLQICTKWADSDHPVHVQSMIWAFALIYTFCSIQWDCADTQTDLGLPCMYMLKDTFCMAWLIWWWLGVLHPFQHPFYALPWPLLPYFFYMSLIFMGCTSLCCGLSQIWQFSWRLWLQQYQTNKLYCPQMDKRLDWCYLYLFYYIKRLSLQWLRWCWYCKRLILSTNPQHWSVYIYKGWISILKVLITTAADYNFIFWGYFLEMIRLGILRELSSRHFSFSTKKYWHLFRIFPGKHTCKYIFSQENLPYLRFYQF